MRWRRFLALLRKELHGYFAQPLLWVVGTVFQLLAGYYLYTDLAFFLTFGLGESIYENYFAMLLADQRLVLLLTVPLLTMRLFAEEKKLGTAELLFTWPIGDLEIILAKLLACLIAIAFLLLGTIVPIAYLHHLQPFPVAPLVAGYLGLLLLGLAFAVFGLFVSALTDSHVTAAMASLGTLLLLWILSWNEAAADPETLAWLHRISLLDRFDPFSRGVVETRDLVYFAAWTILGVATTAEVLGARAWRGNRLAITVTGLVGLSLAAALLVALGDRYSVRFDLTPTRRYTLSPHARRVLAELSRDVDLIAFTRGGDPRNPTIHDLVQRIGEAAPRVRVREFDVDRNPAIARRYGIERFGAIVVDAGGARPRIVTTPREDRVVGALLELTQPQRRLAFTTGHGERDVEDTGRSLGASSLANALEDESYRVEGLSLDSPVPSDVAVLVIAGGRGQWSAGELRHLDDFADRGGRILAMLDPLATPELAAWLARRGIAPRGDVVIDPAQRLAGGEPVTWSARPVDHGASAPEKPPGSGPTRGSARAIADTLDQGVLVSFARSLEAAEGSEPLLESSGAGWATTSMQRAERGLAEMDPAADRRGPLTLAAALEWPTKGGTAARLIVVGDSDLATNKFFELQANKDFLINAVNWLAGAEDLIELRPKRREIGREQLFLSAADARATLLLGVGLVPALHLLVALALGLRERWRP